MEYTFDFIGAINDDNVISLRNFVRTLKPPIDKLIINISSCGGSVISGITAYNLLKSMPFQIQTHNLGEVSSAAILLYLAGNIRTSENVSKFMIHPLSIGISGDLPYYKVQEILNQIDADIQNYYTVIKNEIQNIEDMYDIENYLKNDSLVLNKQQAFTCGFVTNL